MTDALFFDGERSRFFRPLNSSLDELQMTKRGLMKDGKASGSCLR